MSMTDFLSNGEEQAIPLDALGLASGLPERAVKAEVLRSRMAGELILSSERGYFLPADPDEIRRYVNSRKRYIKTAAAALRPFIKALGK